MNTVVPLVPVGKVYPSFYKYLDVASELPCMTAVEKATLMAIGLLCGKAGVSAQFIGVIAHKSGASYGAARNALTAWEELGWITITRRMKPDVPGKKPQNDSSIYELHLPMSTHVAATCQRCVKANAQTLAKQAAQTPASLIKQTATKQKNAIAKAEAKVIADQEAALEARIKTYQRSGVEPTEKAYDAMLIDMGHGGEEKRQYRYECFTAAWRDWRAAQDAKQDGCRIDCAAKDEAYAEVGIDVDDL